MRKVASLIAVFVDGYGIAVERSAYESMESHVGTLAGSVDGEVSQRHGRNIEIRVIEQAQVFRGELCDPVRRNWLRHHIFAYRQRTSVAINR